MAQLVKLQDYISRYQIDFARYPTQFVRLKKSQWERVKVEWQTGTSIERWEHLSEEAADIADELFEEKKSRFSFLKKLLPVKRANQHEIEEDVESIDVANEFDDDQLPDNDTTLLFEPNIVYNPKSLEELKRAFLDQFFHFQMKWASSTIREKSYVDPKYMRDSLLRTFLQSLPDSYLLFYYPILRLKKAPIELDIILLTPTECICIKALEEDDQAVYVADGERFWTKKVGRFDKKILNPFIELNRTEAIVQKVFQAEGSNMPIKKVILSRNGYFDIGGTTFGVQFVDKRKFEEWFLQLKKSVSPMKHMQIKSAQAILSCVETTSFNRDLWNADGIELAEQDVKNIEDENSSFN